MIKILIKCQFLVYPCSFILNKINVLSTLSSSIDTAKRKRKNNSENMNTETNLRRRCN